MVISAYVHFDSPLEKWFVAAELPTSSHSESQIALVFIPVDGGLTECE